MDTMDTMPMEEAIEPQEPMPVQSGVKRDTPEPEPARAALVRKLTDRVVRARKFWTKRYDRMREEMRFAAGEQWPEGSDAYVANITQRALQQLVSTLYAKNPKAVARRRRQREFQLWDGELATLQAAQQEAAMAQQMAMQTGVYVPSQSQAILADYEHGMQQRKMLDGICETLELVYQHQMDVCQPPFKGQMKGLVRRAATVGAAFLRLSVERETASLGDEEKTGLEAQVAAAQRRLADLQDGEVTQDHPEVEEAKIMLLEIQSKLAAPPEIKSERLTFSFPKSTAVIVDPHCTSLRGFVGAGWVAQEFLVSPERIQEVYGVDVRTGGAASYEDGKRAETTTRWTNAHSQKAGESEDGATTRVCVWELWEKETQMRYMICDGHKDFLCEPEAPAPALKRFFPLFALALNELESEDNDPEEGFDIYPPSIVRLLMPMQHEINRSREALRLHRIANKSKYGVAAGRLSVADVEKLQCHPDNAVLEIQGLAPGEKVSDLLQPIMPVPILPEVYDTTHVMQDILAVIGQQEANLGPTSGKTATESSIAESSRLTSTGSSIDDIDDFLTEIAEAAGEVIMTEFSPQTVQQIVGPGAVWPELNRDAIKNEIYLQVEAASSGRPNKSLEVQNFRELAPLLMGIPGIRADFMAREAVKRLDDKLDVDEAFSAGAPALNAPPMPGPEMTGADGEPQPGQGQMPPQQGGGMPPGPIQQQPQFSV